MKERQLQTKMEKFVPRKLCSSSGRRGKEGVSERGEREEETDEW